MQWLHSTNWHHDSLFLHPVQFSPSFICVACMFFKLLRHNVISRSLGGGGGGGGGGGRERDRKQERLSRQHATSVSNTHSFKTLCGYRCYIYKMHTITRDLLTL